MHPKNNTRLLAPFLVVVVAGCFACAPDGGGASTASRRFIDSAIGKREQAIASTSTTTTTTITPSYCGFVDNFVQPVDGYQYYATLTMHPRHDTSTSWSMPTNPGENT